MVKEKFNKSAFAIDLLKYENKMFQNLYVTI